MRQGGSGPGKVLVTEMFGHLMIPLGDFVLGLCPFYRVLSSNHDASVPHLDQETTDLHGMTDSQMLQVQLLGQRVTLVRQVRQGRLLLGRERRRTTTTLWFFIGRRLFVLPTLCPRRTSSTIVTFFTGRYLFAGHSGLHPLLTGSHPFGTGPTIPTVGLAHGIGVPLHVERVTVDRTRSARVGRFDRDLEDSTAKLTRYGPVTATPDITATTKGQCLTVSVWAKPCPKLLLKPASFDLVWFIFSLSYGLLSEPGPGP